MIPVTHNRAMRRRVQSAHVNLMLVLQAIDAGDGLAAINRLEDAAADIEKALGIANDLPEAKELR